MTQRSPNCSNRFLTDELVQLRDEGHAALLFSQFTRALDLVEEQLSAEGIRFYVWMAAHRPIAEKSWSRNSNRKMAQLFF